MMDKTAIITGGSCAIGHNTAINLSQRAADIISLISRIEAESLMGEIEAMRRKAAAFQRNVGDPHSFGSRNDRTGSCGSC